ncbi:hypothetical protein DXT97_12630 [Agrobacterium tumefaciens]|uniref:hypothetical protein n=1 Tax=Agrobacterium tumefaciens TaxID=358 RepID=UPI0012955FF7|nr:hypothetical protein [Agrobacterium tumefaciens]MQB37638.1 hypothetical protein [Agrobacterium tumefaciens]
MSYASEQGVLNAQYNTEIIRQLPHVLMRPTLIQDGNAWLAIYGDLPTGVVGAGSTPAEAMADFDEAWTRPSRTPAAE